MKYKGGFCFVNIYIMVKKKGRFERDIFLFSLWLLNLLFLKFDVFKVYVFVWMKVEGGGKERREGGDNI